VKPVHLRPIHGALGAAAILALAACGANGDSSTDRDAIEALLVRHYATLPCDDLADAGRTEFGHPVPDEECEADLASQETKDVEVSEIEVDGDRATAVVDSFTFRLVQDDGEWHIDGGT
jgi:hypothetical protein